MSTHDVPGSNPKNGDDLHMGCWATHDDGSIIFVESTEGGRVVYSMFDLSTEPVTEYRDSMSLKGFQDAFTSSGWTWHDKKPMDWDLVIGIGAKSGERYTHADHTISEAERISKSRNIRKNEFRQQKWKHMRENMGRKGHVIIDKLQRAINELKS